MMFANAQDFFAVQQQMQQLEALNKIGANIQESIDLGGKCTRACSRGDWSEAVRYSPTKYERSKTIRMNWQRSDAKTK